MGYTAQGDEQLFLDDFRKNQAAIEAAKRQFGGDFEGAYQRVTGKPWPAGRSVKLSGGVPIITKDRSVKSVLGKVGQVAAIAAPIVAAPFTGGMSLAAIGALSGAAGAKLSGAGWKGTLAGAGLGAIPGLGGAGGVAKRAAGETVAAAAKRALVNPQTVARLAAPVLPGKTGQAAQYAAMFLPGARPAPTLGATAPSTEDLFANNLRRGITGESRGPAVPLFGGSATAPSTENLFANNLRRGMTGGNIQSFVAPSAGGVVPTVANTGLTTLDKINIGAYGLDYVTKQIASRSQGKADESAQAWDRQVYEEQKKLLAEQRLEDQQLAREKLARDEARWNAQQAEIKRKSDLEDTRYAESEARKAPYRAGGLQTLARLNAASQPTVTPYESRFMGQR